MYEFLLSFRTRALIRITHPSGIKNLFVKPLSKSKNKNIRYYEFIRLAVIQRFHKL